MMNPAPKPWSNHRQILWASGVLGLILLGFSCLAHLFLGDGFKPGGPPSRGRPEEWLCVPAIAAAFIYYVVVAHSIWSRKLRTTGTALHAMLPVPLAFWPQVGLSAVFALPLLFIGTLVWVVYAAINKLPCDAA
jgi:hypothetical protein